MTAKIVINIKRRTMFDSDLDNVCDIFNRIFAVTTELRNRYFIQ